ncbi:MAG: divergent polysaccharide deacetylase family protein [Rectinemataceae bacterium]
MAVTRTKGARRRGKKSGKAKAEARSSTKPSKSIGFVTLSLAAVALALIALLGGLCLRSSALVSEAVPAETPPAAPALEPVEAPTAEPATVRIPQKTATALQPASNRPNLRPLPLPKGRYLVFIIDDAGYSLTELDAFLRLPFPLTIAVLPGLPNSEKAAAAVRAAGKELILHQPMQALGGQDPGPGALRLGMSRNEVERVVEANLRTMPGAAGMNNHMGSAATADLGIMEAVAAVAKRRGIYYLDSLTTSGTAVAAAARREGIPYWERDVFLDNSPDRASIIRAVEDGKKHAAKARPAVMIGHVWSAELAQTLMYLYPQLVSEGFSLSTISRFMVQEATEDDASIGD